MADLSTIYAGVVEYYDPDIVVGRVPGPFPWSPSTNLYIPDHIREMIRKNNTDSKDTIEAVRVPYIAGGNRTMWVQARIKAVDERVKFIKKRTDALLANLKESGDPLYDTLASAMKVAVSAVPVIGSIVSGIISSDQSNQRQAAAIDAYKTQTLLQDYKADIEQLTAIRKALVKEYTAVDEVVSSAPSAGIPWYYVAIVVAVIVLLIYLRNRNRR